MKPESPRTASKAAKAKLLKANNDDELSEDRIKENKSDKSSVKDLKLCIRKASIVHEFDQHQIKKLRDENEKLRQRLELVSQGNHDEYINLKIKDGIRSKMTHWNTIIKGIISSQNVHIGKIKDFSKCLEENISKCVEGGAFSEPQKPAEAIDQLHQEGARLNFEQVLDRIDESPFQPPEVTPQRKNEISSLNDSHDNRLKAVNGNVNLNRGSKGALQSSFNIKPYRNQEHDDLQYSPEFNLKPEIQKQVEDLQYSPEFNPEPMKLSQIFYPTVSSDASIVAETFIDSPANFSREVKIPQPIREESSTDDCTEPATNSISSTESTNTIEGTRKFSDSFAYEIPPFNLNCYDDDLTTVNESLSAMFELEEEEQGVDENAILSEHNNAENDARFHSEPAIDAKAIRNTPTLFKPKPMNTVENRDAEASNRANSKLDAMTTPSKKLFPSRTSSDSVSSSVKRNKRSATKVVNYKEPNLHKKMRRDPKVGVSKKKNVLPTLKINLSPKKVTHK